MRVVRRLEVHVVVAATVEPGQPDGAHDAVVSRIVRQIVKHDVAVSDAERRRRSIDDGYHVIANITDFIQAFRLRIGEQHRIELSRFLPPAQREVDARRQRPGRRQAGEAKPKVRRAVGCVHVSEVR